MSTVAKKEVKQKKVSLPKEISSAFYSIVPEKERRAFQKVMDYGHTLSAESSKLRNEQHKIYNEMNDLYKTFGENLKYASFSVDIEKSILTVSYDESVNGKVSEKIEPLIKEYKILVNKTKRTSEDRKKIQNLHSEISIAVRRELSDSKVEVTKLHCVSWTVDCVYSYEQKMKKEINLSKNKEFIALRKRKIANDIEISKNEAIRKEFDNQMSTTHCLAGSRMPFISMFHPAMMFGGIR